MSTVGTGPTPEMVRQVLQGPERQARLARHPPEMVEAVLRYGRPVGSRILWHPFLQSGRAVARQHIAAAEAGGPALATGTVIGADVMAGAGGRFQRGWHAPAGGLWCTVLLVDTLLPAFSALYPVATGVAVCEAVRETGIRGNIRWVNDVMAGNTKVAGILLETVPGHRSGETYLLLGLGVNVNNRDFPPDLAGRATSLSLLLGHDLDRDRFAATLLAKLAWNIGLLHYCEARELAGDHRGAPVLLDRYRQLCDTPGHRVVFGFDVETAPQYTGTALAIDDDGALAIRLDDDGRVIHERAGEVRYR